MSVVSTIVKTSHQDWTCNARGEIGYFSGVHSWSVTLDNTPYVSVGICREDIHKTDCSRNNDKRMDIYCVTGDVIIGDSVATESYLPGPLKKGDTITFLLDMDQCRLLVALNGRWQNRPALTNIPQGVWYPYLCLQRKGCQVTLVYA